MADLNPLSDKDETPEDVATLYSWANLHGAKYRDFSASRAQTREKARQRAEQAAEEEQQRVHREAEEARAAEARHAAEESRAAEAAYQTQLAAEQAARQSEWASQQAAAREAQRPAQQAAEEASRVAAEQAAQRAAHRAAQEAAEQAAQRSAERAQELAAQLAAQQAAEVASRMAAEQEAQRAAQRAAQEAAEQAARLSAERAQQLAAQQAAEGASRMAAEQDAQRAAQRAAQEAAEQAARLSAERAQELAAQLAAEQAAQLAAQQAAQHEAEQAAERAQEQAAQQRVWPRPDRFPAAPFAVPAAPSSPPQPRNIDYAAYGRTQPPRPAPSQPSQLNYPNYAPVHEENPMPARNPWAAPDMQEPIGRPAWLTPDRQQTDRPEPQTQSVPQPSLPGTPEDTLQGSRDRLTSRWFALRGIFDGTPAPVEAIPPPLASRAPALAVFSLAGGVGKTSLVATLGRALSARGERVLLVDTAAFGLLPFFFGATDQRPGLLRTFSPPGVSSDAPIQMVTIDPEGLDSEAPNQEALSSEIQKFSRGVSRVIVDLATASGATTRRIMRLSPLVLVPVIPDMNSVVSVSSIDAFFEHNSNPAGAPALPYYVLNQFDASLPLHLDVREVLREQLGDRLLPFALRRTPAMSEALAEGMTVMDYAPNSSLADDFSTLAGWVKSLSAPATTSYRGVRWSER